MLTLMIRAEVQGQDRRSAGAGPRRPAATILGMPFGAAAAQAHQRHIRGGLAYTGRFGVTTVGTPPGDRTTLPQLSGPRPQCRIPAWYYARYYALGGPARKSAGRGHYGTCFTYQSANGSPSNCCEPTNPHRRGRCQPTRGRFTFHSKGPAAGSGGAGAGVSGGTGPQSVYTELPECTPVGPTLQRAPSRPVPLRRGWRLGKKIVTAIHSCSAAIVYDDGVRRPAPSTNPGRAASYHGEGPARHGLVSAAAQMPRMNDAAVPNIIATSDSSTLRRSRIKGGGASSSFAALRTCPSPGKRARPAAGPSRSAAHDGDARTSRRRTIASIATCGAPRQSSCAAAQSFAARS